MDLENTKILFFANIRVILIGKQKVIDYFANYLGAFFKLRSYDCKSPYAHKISIKIFFCKQPHKLILPNKRDSVFVLNQPITEYYDEHQSIYIPSSSKHPSYPKLVFKPFVVEFTQFELDETNAKVLIGILREIYTSLQISENWHLFHANGLINAEHDFFAIIGNSNSGKTALSLGLSMNNNIKFVADDRIFIQQDNAVGSITENIANLAYFNTIISKVSSFNKVQINFNPAKLKILLFPNFSSDHHKEPTLSNLSYDSKLRLLNKNYLSKHCLWLKTFKVIPNTNHINANLEYLANFKSVQITFGPHTNYKKLYENIATLL